MKRVMLSVALLLVGLGGLWWSGVFVRSGTVIEESAGNPERGGAEAAAQQAGASGSATALREGAEAAEGNAHDLRRAVDRNATVSHDQGSVHRLRLKVFLGAGRPLTQGTVECRFRFPGSSAMQLENAQLILEGSNEAQVALKYLPVPCPKVWVAMRYVDWRPGRTHRTWRLEMTLAGPEKGEPWVAPDCVLQMQEEQLLCKGTVLDGDGQPIAGCIITWRDENKRPWRMNFGPDLGKRVSVSSSPQGETVNITYSRDSWAFESRSLEPASDGSFEIWGRSRLQGSLLFLSARAAGYLSVKDQEVLVGSMAVRLVLAKAGTLEGFFKLPYGVTIKDLKVALFPEGAKVPASQWSSKAQSAPVILTRPEWKTGKARFALEPIPAGRYDLHVGFLSAYETLTVIPGIDVHPGRVSRDLRVQGLDLSHLLTKIQVAVRSEQGAVLRSVRVLYSLDNPIAGGLAGGEVVDAQGNATLTIPSRGVALRIALQGYEERRFPKIQRGLTVTLAPDTRPKVEVRIGAGLTEETGRRVRVQLQLMLDAKAPPGDRKPRVPKPIHSRAYSLTGRFYFRRITPGKYRVSLTVRDAGNKQNRFAVEGDGEFRVQHGSKKQILDVAVDWVRLKRLLATGRER